LIILSSTDIQDVESTSNAYYVIMTLDKLNLVVPQTHIYGLEPTLDVAFSKETSVGSIKVETTTYPVYSLSDNLTLLDSVPIHRRICVLLHTSTPISGTDIQNFFLPPTIDKTMDELPLNLFGLLCNQVILAEWKNTATIFPLPACMQTPYNRLKGLMLENNEILCITTAQDLMNCCQTSPNLEQKFYEQ